MVRAAQWLLCTYLVLKFLQYFFVGRPGFAKTELGFREKLIRGEPILFIVSFTLAVPAALWSDWHFRRGFERGLEHSADCYGRLGALRHLTAVETQFDALRVFRQVQAAKQAVSLAAHSLKLTPADADKLMAERRGFYTARYVALSRQRDGPDIRAQAAAIERCMSEPMISF